MTNKILEILQELQKRDVENIYTSIKNFFDYENFPFQVLDLKKHQTGKITW